MSSLQTIHLLVGSSEPILGGVYASRMPPSNTLMYSMQFTILALTCPRDFTTDPYMSAQLNDAISLPVHKDKNNLPMTWLIAFGDFTGGRLLLESPVGTEPPRAPQTAGEKNLRGEYHSVLSTWVHFDPRLYHAVEPITSGSQRSLALSHAEELAKASCSMLG